jgi:hypothetical protein
MLTLTMYDRIIAPFARFQMEITALFVSEGFNLWLTSR